MQINNQNKGVEEVREVEVPRFTTTVKESTPRSCLLDKKIKIRPVPIRRTPFIIGGDRDRVKSEQIFLTGTSRSIICPLDGYTGRMIDPLSFDERLFLEPLLGANLDVNKPENNLLKELRVTIVKDIEDLERVYAELDLSNPYDYIKYKICLASPLVANSKKEMYTPDEMFYIDDNVVEVKSEREDNKVEDTCLKYLFSIEGKKEKLYNFLRSYNFLNKTRKIVDKAATEDWLYNEIKELIKYKDTRGRVHQLVEMINKDEASYETKLLIQDALEIGELRYNSQVNEYTLPSGDMIGKGISEVEQFLRNPKNQVQKEYIKTQIKNALK